MATPQSAKNSAVHAAWGSLPAQMRVLYLAGRERTGRALAEALAGDSASRVELEESGGRTEGLARLREEVFDAVLISHEPDDFDALDLLEGFRAAEGELPVIVLGSAEDPDMASLCYEAGADGYLCVRSGTVRNLIWLLARAVERRQLMREHRRLAQAERQRLQHEHLEVERLLEQQRALIGDLEALRSSAMPVAATDQEEASAPVTAGDPSAAARAGFEPPAQLVAHYRELLRMYVIMGSGNLVHEIKQLAGLFVAAGISADQTLQLHLQVLEDLIRGLGSRSTRHVMTRGDLMALEVMIHLAEGYRRRWSDAVDPPRQKLLPGFDGDLLAA
ncbi:MAG: hypothetical protein K1X74_06495 [Pirellulales bacterium]|nr:hypothetical protein [Pirellulales bacterium]